MEHQIKVTRQLWDFHSTKQANTNDAFDFFSYLLGKWPNGFLAVEDINLYLSPVIFLTIKCYMSSKFGTNVNVYVVVQSYPWFNFYLSLFYTHYSTLPYTKMNQGYNWTKTYSLSEKGISHWQKPTWMENNFF